MKKIWWISSLNITGACLTLWMMSQIIGLGVGCDEILSDSTVQMFVASPGWRTASQSVHQNMVGKNFGMFSQGDSWCLKKTLLLLCRIDMEAMS